MFSTQKGGTIGPAFFAPEVASSLETQPEGLLNKTNQIESSGWAVDRVQVEHIRLTRKRSGCHDRSYQRKGEAPCYTCSDSSK